MSNLPVLDKKQFLKVVNARPPKYLKPEQIHAIISNAQKDRYKTLFLLLWSTGARISEALALKVEDVDWGMKQIRFITEKRRGKAERLVPVGTELLGQLATYIQTAKLGSQDRLFKMTPVAVHKELKLICRKAGLPGWIHAHTFRHSFAINCLTQGVTINTVKELMGHANVETTMIYLKIFQPDIKEQLSRVTF